MRRGVVRLGGEPLVAIDLGPDGLAGFEHAVDDGHDDLVGLEAQDCLDRGATTRAGDRAGVGDLAATFGIERGALELEQHASCVITVDWLQRRDRRLDSQLVEADELAARGIANELCCLLGRQRAAACRCTRPLTLLVHQLVEACSVDLRPPLAGELLGQLNREAERVM